MARRWGPSRRRRWRACRCCGAAWAWPGPTAPRTTRAPPRGGSRGGRGGGGGGGGGRGRRRGGGARGLPGGRGGREARRGGARPAALLPRRGGKGEGDEPVERPRRRHDGADGRVLLPPLGQGQ